MLIHWAKMSCESFDGASTLESFRSEAREINTAKLKYINREEKADKLTDIQEVVGNSGARYKMLRMKQLQTICLKFSRFVFKQAYIYMCGIVTSIRHDLQFNISESKDNGGISGNCQAGGTTKINRYKQVEVNSCNVFKLKEEEEEKKDKMNNEDIRMLHGVNGETSGTYRPLYPV